MLRTWREDFRSVARGLFRSRAFAIAAALTLAAGAAASLVVFTLVRSVLLRPLPVRDQHELIVAWRDLPASGYAHDPFGDRAVALAAADLDHFAAVAGVDANGVGRVVLAEDGDGAAVNDAVVTGRFFEVLGVAPVLGRTLTAADDVDGAEPVLVIGHALWRTRFAASPGVLGRRVTLGERRYTIVGVMPADLDYPSGVDVWAPTHSVPTDGPFGDAARREIDLVARLRAGTTMAEATAALQAVLRHDEAEYGQRGSVANVRRFEDAIVGASRRPLLALLAAVTLVLLVACANVANLQLMRMEGRRGELAVHAALGASRARLVRQVALEMLMLGGAATALGALVAWWSIRGLVAALPAGLPRVAGIGMDASVAAFAAALPWLMTAIASVPAALLVGRQSIAGALASAGRGAPAPARGRRLLVVVQVALAVAIVASAGVLVRGVVRLRALDTGLAEDRLLFAELSLTGAAADRARHGQVLDAIVARVRSLPGVVDATPVNAWPYAEAGWDVPAFTAEGQDATTAAANPALNFEAIGPHHFATLQVPIVRGRAFTLDDRPGAPAVAIVSADVAARTWPGRSPIGRRVKVGGPESGEPWWTIVGVAAPTRYRELSTARPTIYVPAAQFLDTAERLAIRTSIRPESVAPAIRGHVEAIDRGVRVLRVATFEAIVSEPLAQPRLQATVSGAFAITAALLAGIGLYAVLAAAVRHRNREIAIRMAVGATPWRIRRLVVAEAVMLAGIGAAGGAIGAVVIARVWGEAMPGASSEDPAALAIAVVVLLVLTALAAYWPIRAATRVDPIVSLRA
jgi:putative ABC transport system permease protein